MLAILGTFPFQIKTLPYQSDQRQSQFNHAEKQRIGERPVSQFLGVGKDSKTLTGVLLPQITGGQMRLDVLRVMAESGKSWILIEGTGRILGLWVINSISETKTEFFNNGAPKKIEFTIKLSRVASKSDKYITLGNIGLGAVSKVSNISSTINKVGEKIDSLL